nr:alpha/beta hydrolase [uncultured Draconibacterium sp.]
MKIANQFVLIISALTLFISCARVTDTNKNESDLSAAETAPAWTINDVPVAAGVVMENRYPKTKISFPGGVVGYQDLVYQQISGYRPQRLDLYLPADTTTTHPLIMYIHGGGWQNGHSRNSGAFDNWPATLAMLASRGYVVTSINYRLGGEEKFPAAVQDVKTAIRWLRANAGEYGIDKDKFMVWGASAGGHLAALAGTSGGVEELEPVNLPDELATESDQVQATVCWYGIFDLTGMGEGGGPGGYFAGKAKLASPVNYVDETDGAFLLIHGSEDPVIPYQQSIDFNELLTANNLKSSVHIIPGVAHSFIGETGESTKEASIEALQMVMDFMDDVFKSN